MWSTQASSNSETSTCSWPNWTVVSAFDFLWSFKCFLYGLTHSFPMHPFSRTSKTLKKAKFSLCRSSHRRCSVRKVLRNFTKFIGKQLCHCLFFKKVAGLRPATMLKKRLWHRYFPVNFAKFLRTPSLQNISGRLLLIVHKWWLSLSKKQVDKCLYSLWLKDFPEI